MTIAFLREVLRVAAQLGFRPWERVALVLAVAFMLVLGKKGWQALLTVKLEEQLTGSERDNPSKLVDSNGTPVGNGPPPENESGSGG